MQIVGNLFIHMESIFLIMFASKKGLLEQTNSILKRSREVDPQPMEIPDRITENTPQFESTRQTDAKNNAPPKTSTPQKDSRPKESLNDDKVIEDEDLIEDVHSSELDKMPDDRDLICPETNDVPRDMDEDDDIVLSSGDENFETPKSSPKKLEKGANCSRQLNLESDSDEDKPKLRRKKKARTPPGLREEKQSEEFDDDDDDTTLIGDDMQATITPKVSFHSSYLLSLLTLYRNQ